MEGIEITSADLFRLTLVIIFAILVAHEVIDIRSRMLSVREACGELLIENY